MSFCSPHLKLKPLIEHRDEGEDFQTTAELNSFKQYLVGNNQTCSFVLDQLGTP